MSVMQPYKSRRAICFIACLLVLYVGYSQNVKSTQIEEIWRITRQSKTKELVIAVIDGGVLTTHSILKNNIWINKQEIQSDGLDNDGNGFIDDYYGWNFKNDNNDIACYGIGNWHGTPVNGIINGICNSTIANQGVKLMNIIKGDSIGAIISSLNYVYEMRRRYNQSEGKDGAFIVAVNCSWGKDSLFAENHSQWCEIYDKLGEEGVLTVTSVPNEDINIDIYGDMPSTCVSDFLITVTNSNSNDKKVLDAGYGRNSVDLSAPGQNTYTISNSGGFGFFDGTSAAAPYVTGTIALLYGMPSDKFVNDFTINPSKVASTVKSMIIQGVDKNAYLQDITLSGGRLNAFKSMKLLCDYYDESHLHTNLFTKINIVSLYPNPSKQHVTISLESSNNKEIEMSMIDIHGYSILNKNVTLTEGINQISLDIEAVASGVYIISILSDNDRTTEKLIVL